MGFTLRIINAPSGATHWSAHFYSEAEGRFISPPGMLALDAIWDCAFNPYGTTDLRVVVLDAVHARTVLDVHNLGPVNDGQDYEFNCSTRELIVVTVEPAPVVHIALIDSIFSFVWDIGDFFRDAYLEVKGWVWPFYYLQYPLYGLHIVFRSMLTPIAHFGDWADDVWAKVLQIFSLEQITSYFRTWLDYATDAWDWISNAWWNVIGIVGDWWAATKVTVLGWIDIVKQWAIELWEDTKKGIAELQPVWDFFKGKIENLEIVLNWYFEWKDQVIAAVIRWGFVTALDVAGLVAAAFLERENLWAGWQDFRDKIADFFTDPLEFLWTLFTDWFLGPEE